jgi:hypothetical protein
MLTKNRNEVKHKIWCKVWNYGMWPKISTFLWLVFSRRALTCDHILEKGYEGP